MTVHEPRYRLPRAPAWLRTALEEGPALPAQLLVAGAFVAMGASEAGYDKTTWYPVALLTLALVAVTAVAVGRPRNPPRLVVAGLVLFGAYTAWTFASIAWAEVEADAWDGANRTAFYLLVLALFALWPPGPTGARLFLATISLGIAGVGLVEILRADNSALPGGFFIDVRFAEPAGYINANVALWTVGMIGCLALAAARKAAPALRGVCLGAATLLAGLALLGQSRGWVFALPLGLIVLMSLSPDRLRVAVGAVLVAAGVVVIRQPLLDVHDEYSPARFDGLLADATAALLLTAVVVGVAGALWAAAERRRHPKQRVRRRISRGTALALAALALAGSAGALIAVGEPLDRVGDAWSDFKGGGGPDADQSRFASSGSNRYDFWGVAWHAFRDHPLQGLGAENFQRLYLRVGESTEKPRYPHSLELEALATLGLPGFLLLIAALGALAVAAASSLRRTRTAAVATASLLAVVTYWLAHASVDWFWAFPALTGPALAALATAAGLGTAPAETVRRIPRPALVAIGLASAVLAISLAGPWLSARQVQSAADSWRGNPDGAFDALDTARSLNPLSTEPDAVAATIALRLSRTDESERLFRAVLEDDPDNAYAAFELGLIAAGDGRRDEALRFLRRSLALSPRDEIVLDVLKRAKKRLPVDPAAVNDRIVGDARDTANRPRGRGR